MKNLQSQLKSVAKSLASLSKQVEKLSTQAKMSGAVKKTTAKKSGWQKNRIGGPQDRA